MRGRHVRKGSKKFIWDVVGMSLAVVVVAAVLGVGAWLFLFSGDDTDASDTSTTSDPQSRTTNTQPSTTSTTEGTTSTTASTSTTLLPTTTTSEVPPVRQPGEITVEVLNAVGISGIAGRLTDQLRIDGYLMLEPDNNTTRLDTSQVLYREEFGAEAAEIANNYLPDAELLANSGTDSAADIQILIGSSYVEEET